MPDEPEALGLLALMLLHDARRAGRVDDAGELIPLEEQDRVALGPGAIAEGVRLLERRSRAAGRAVPDAGRHRRLPRDRRRRRATTDWDEIADIYARLVRLRPSPVVELNRAVAVAMAEGPAAGLALVEALGASGALDGYYLLPATRADLLRRLDRSEEAATAYRDALALATTGPERSYLERRLAEAEHEPRRP